MPADLFSDYEEQDMAEDKGAPAGEQPPTKDANEPRFEESFERLEAIVEEMERGELPLEDLLTRFEEGVSLVRQCRSFLKQAQLRVEQYVEQKDGQWVLKELDG